MQTLRPPEVSIRLGSTLLQTRRGGTSHRRSGSDLRRYGPMIPFSGRRLRMRSSSLHTLGGDRIRKLVDLPMFGSYFSEGVFPA